MDFMNPKNGWEEGGHFFYLRWFLWWLFFGENGICLVVFY